MTDYVALAGRIADDVLFPAAIDVDRSGAVPDSHFRLLADHGFYGVLVPVEHGGSGISLADFYEVAEILVGGCLSTAFVWLQHHFAAGAVAGTVNSALRDEWLSDLVRGERRAGVALAGAIPGSPRLWAKRVEGGYLLSGDAPFVSGWHCVDVVLVLARSLDADDTLVMGLIEPKAPDGPLADPVQLVAVQASDTVRLAFDDHFLPDSAVTGLTTGTAFQTQQVYGSRTNGAVALGITSRCVRLIGEANQAGLAESLRTRLDMARARLDAALTDPSDMPAARAAAAHLAHQAGAAAVVAAGSAGITMSNHAQRLAREGMFTLVAAGRPEIKAELIQLCTAGPDQS